MKDEFNQFLGLEITVIPNSMKLFGEEFKFFDIDYDCENYKKLRAFMEENYSEFRISGGRYCVETADYIPTRLNAYIQPDSKGVHRIARFDFG